jgi:DNA-directed RNA polymerase specialized sigma24 family protein
VHRSDRTIRPPNEQAGAGIHGLVQTGGNVVELHGGRETSAAPLTFDDLFLDQHDRLYRALYFITGSSADAEELMQDAFLKLWERWDRIHVIDDPVGYLFRVAMNGFRMRARRARVAARRIVHLEPTRDPVRRHRATR